MKNIIKIAERIGTEISTRRMVELFERDLSHDDEYLFDMSGVSFISRSAADEIYNIAYCDYHVVLANMEPFVKKMMDVVSVGRFSPRKHDDERLKVIHCKDVETLSKLLCS